MPRTYGSQRPPIQQANKRPRYLPLHVWLEMQDKTKETITRELKV